MEGYRDLRAKQSYSPCLLSSTWRRVWKVQQCTKGEGESNEGRDRNEGESQDCSEANVVLFVYRMLGGRGGKC